MIFLYFAVLPKGNMYNIFVLSGWEELTVFNPKRLVEQRKKRNLTQEQLAHKVKTTKGTISNYENGHSTPPHETLVAIADALGVSTDYLLNRTDDPTPPNPLSQQKAFPTEESRNAALELYYRLPPEKRKIVDDVIKGLFGDRSDKKPDEIL